MIRLEGRKVSGETEAHEGPVYALYAYPAADGSGTCLVTGGGDGKVKTWDSEVHIRSDTIAVPSRAVTKRLACCHSLLGYGRSSVSVKHLMCIW